MATESLARVVPVAPVAPVVLVPVVPVVPVAAVVPVVPATPDARLEVERSSRGPLRGAWRGFAYGLAALAVAGLAILALAPSYAGVWLTALYCIPANSILPVPHEPAILFVAPYYAPIWLAIAATAGSVVASFSDYAIVQSALRRPRIAAIRETRFGAWAIRWMQRAPFAIVVACSFVPLLPISIVRALAPAAGYPLRRYIAAQIAGRLPRFYLLAWLGNVLAIPGWVLAGVALVTVGVAVLASRKPT